MAAVQKRIIIGLEYLSTIYLYCKSCCGEAAYPMRSTDECNPRELPSCCPFCNTGFSDFGEERSILREEAVVRALRNLLSRQDNRKAQLRFGIETHTLEGDTFNA